MGFFWPNIGTCCCHHHCLCCQVKKESNSILNSDWQLIILKRLIEVYLKQYVEFFYIAITLSALVWFLPGLSLTIGLKEKKKKKQEKPFVLFSFFFFPLF